MYVYFKPSQQVPRKVNCEPGRRGVDTAKQHQARRSVPYQDPGVPEQPPGDGV